MMTSIPRTDSHLVKWEKGKVRCIELTVVMVQDGQGFGSGLTTFRPTSSWKLRTCRSRSLMHISCVRGSPLIRTALVLLAILVSGLVFSHLTTNQESKPVTGGEKTEIKSKRIIRAHYILTLSERAAHVEIESAGEISSTNLSSESGIEPLTGDIKIDVEKPVVLLKVKWYELGDRRGFAKLAIEAEGQETVTRVFDAEEDIDELFELTF